MIQNRNKISFLLGGVIVIFAIYLSITVNPVLGASLLVVLPLLLCCLTGVGVVGVCAIMWLVNQSKMKKDSKKDEKRKSGCCI
ncbi:MAG: hypothetical protein ACYC6W_08480 [Nitrosotalea sp.]